MNYSDDPSTGGPFVVQMATAMGYDDHDGDMFKLWLRFVYLADDPYAVRIAFSDVPFTDPWGPLPVTWWVSREVLCNAALWGTAAGPGDFHAAPRGDSLVRITLLDTHTGRAPMHVDVPNKVLSAFLWRTLKLVPAGQESRYLQLDKALARLFRLQLDTTNEE